MSADVHRLDHSYTPRTPALMPYLGQDRALVPSGHCLCSWCSRGKRLFEASTGGIELRLGRTSGGVEASAYETVTEEDPATWWRGKSTAPEDVAQLEEHGDSNATVAGSTPAVLVNWLPQATELKMPVTSNTTMENEQKIKHIVGFSGGIDSQATARWVLNRKDPRDVILLNSDVGGHEHPITTDFIQWYSDNIHPVVVVSPIVADLESRGTKKGATKERRDRYANTDPLTFDVLAEIKGLFPARKMQFCTEHLKLAPAKRWQDENISPEFEIIRYSGIRRSESQKRKDAKAWDYDAYFNCQVIQPIVDWSKQMAFDYIKAHGEKINDLYTMGFTRVGCAPCINSNKNDIRQWATRFPEMIDKVDQWEQRTGLTFFRMKDKAGSLMFVRRVVKWSMTHHGGKQYDLLVLQDPPACESKYGLCE